MVAKATHCGSTIAAFVKPANASDCREWRLILLSQFLAGKKLI